MKNIAIVVQAPENTTQRRNNVCRIPERAHTVALDPLLLGKFSVCVVFSPRLRPSYVNSRSDDVA